jgi:hypothetical protein
MEIQAPWSFFITMIFIVLSTALVVISRMVIFEKAGRSNVSAFIPFLNFYVMLRMAGMKKVWTFFYIITLFNIFLTLKSMMPLLMPDEVVQSRMSLTSFLIPFLHPRMINTWFVVYWVVNAWYFFLYVKMHVKIAARFHKPTIFGIGMAFLEPVFYPILAFGKAEMHKDNIE